MAERNVVEDDSSVRVPRVGFRDKCELNRQTAYNRNRVERANACGCFYCGSTFAGSEITEWLAEDDGEDTALCPYCGTDAVIVGTEQFPLSTALLSMLYISWFGEEYKNRKERATKMPTFRGRLDFFRKGIPFLYQETDDASIVGEIRLISTRSIESEQDGLYACESMARAIGIIGDESEGGVVSVRVFFDEDGCCAVDFLDEDGKRLSYEPWSRGERDLLLSLAKEHGDSLKGIIKENDFDPLMQLFVEK